MKSRQKVTKTDADILYDRNLVRFDWAIKRLLRQKANFVILEGLLSVLLNDRVNIVRMLSEEGNKENREDKFNRLDMLAETKNNGLVLIEVQNQNQLDYFHRILYGTSKVLTEYIHESDAYSKIKKLYSVNILNFKMGQGTDYLYRGRTDFKGVFKHDTLFLTEKQQEQFRCGKEVGNIFPEYYILRVEDFNRKAVTPLDEWFSFLKTGVIPEDAKAPGLPEARQCLRRDHLSRAERADYEAHIEAVRYQNSVIQTGLIEGEAKGIAKGIAQGKAEGIAQEKAKAAQEKAKSALKMVEDGIPFDMIGKYTGFSVPQIEKLISEGIRPAAVKPSPAKKPPAAKRKTPVSRKPPKKK